MTRRRAAPLSHNDLVLCDFDGTISVEDTGLAVINALRLEEAWEAERSWRRGEISSMECLTRQWAMVKLSPAALLALFDSFALREEFCDFHGLVRARGARLVVVSDGLDLYVDRMLRRLGYAICQGEAVLGQDDNCIPRFANHAEVTESGVRIEFPHRTPICQQCGNCKLQHLFTLRSHFRRVIYIGDGYSDVCPAKYADVLFARAHLAEEAGRHGVSFIPFEGFKDIMAALA